MLNKEQSFRVTLSPYKPQIRRSLLTKIYWAGAIFLLGVAAGYTWAWRALS